MIFNIHAGRMHLSKLPVKQAKLFRDTQKTSVHETFGLSFFKKKFNEKGNHWCKDSWPKHRKYMLVWFLSFFLSLKWKYVIADIWVYYQYLLHIRSQIWYLWEAGWQRLTRERWKLLTWLKKSFSLVPHTLIDHIVFYIVMLTTSLMTQVHTPQVGPKVGIFFTSNFMVILQNHDLQLLFPT